MVLMVATTQNISSLNAGLYTLTVYDSVCNISFVNSYTVNEPSLITYSSSSLPNSSCDSTQCTGLISASLNGGTQPYQYTWSYW